MWTLVYHPSGEEKTLANWGIVADLPFEFNSQAKSLVDIITVDEFDDAFQWAYGSRVTIWRDRDAVGVGGTIFFSGYVAQPRRSASGQRQQHRYTLYDWWWLAERTPFRRGRKSFEGSLISFSTVPPTEVVLYENYTEGKVTTREQILEVLTLLNECWNPTRRGTGGPVNGALDVVVDGDIDPDLDVPRYPVRDVMCSEVLQHALAWLPDTVVATDYSVHPPVVSVKQMRNMPAEVVTLPADRATAVELKPRYDLQMPAVILYFKKLHTANGSSGWRFYVDKYPEDTNEYYPDARIHTIDLAGSVTNTVQAVLSATAIEANSGTAATKVAWWKSKVPWLRDGKIKASTITISDVAATDADGNALNLAGILAATPNELTEGSLAQWMEEDQADVVFTAKVSYERYADTGQIIKAETVSGRPITCRIRATSAGPGEELTYSTIAFADAGDAIPAGLAQQIYEAHETLQHEGTVQLVGKEIPSHLVLGKVLVLATPGASYDLLIQRVTGELTMGRLAVHVGPPGHLSIQDMIQLHTVNRNRQTFSLPSNASNPVVDIGSQFVLPKQPPRQDSTAGGGDQTFDAATATL